MNRFLKLTLLISLLCSAFIGCAQMMKIQTSSKETTQTRIDIVPDHTFGLYFIKQAPIKDHVKDFSVAKRIFITSTVVIDGNGKITIDGRSSNIVAADALQGTKVITYDVLMRKALEYGADDVVNLVMEIEDTQESTVDTSLVDKRSPAGRTTQVTQTKSGTKRTIVYKATALAIKYK